MTSVTWILESDVFPNSHGRLREAISDAGHRIVDSQDEWWLHEPPEFNPETPVIFHGSLGNAAVIEMKTFGGVDLYDCDAAAIVSAVSNYAIQNHPG
ncbi:hypothetical protein [Novipirellula caenicola]|uniref:Uncharacterized protein n=1 Tax=Novipirellula caenicola TaxID=1536901 RepID=A0ABP9VMP0_9BACT